MNKRGACVNWLDFLYAVFSVMPRSLKLIYVNCLTYTKNLCFRRPQTPSKITFFVTSKCNAFCKFCFYKSNLNKSQNEVKLQEVEKIAHSLRNSASLVITGGEPFMRDDIFQLCRAFYIRKKTGDIRIATNGFLTKDILSVCGSILRESHINLTVQVSLDAIGKQHDDLRGVEGIFDRAMESIEGLVILSKKFPNLRVEPNCVCSRYNYNTIMDLARLVMTRFNLALDVSLARGICSDVHNPNKNSSVSANNVSVTGELPNHEEVIRLFKDLNLFYGQAKSLSRVIVDFYYLEKKCESDIIFTAKRPIFKCPAGATDAVIYPNGDVALCENMQPFANLRDYGLELYRLWNSDKADKARDNIEHCFCPHPCYLSSAIKNDFRALLYMGDKSWLK